MFHVEHWYSRWRLWSFRTGFQLQYVREEKTIRGQEHDLNQTAYRRMQDAINKKYAYGRFVAIVGGQVVADAGEFDELHAILKAAGNDPIQAFIIQAGHEYPAHAVIFAGKFR